MTLEVKFVISPSINPSFRLRFTLRSDADSGHDVTYQKNGSHWNKEEGEVLAEFSALQKGLVFTGKFSPRYMHSYLLPVETQTYRNVVGMLVNQVRSPNCSVHNRFFDKKIKHEIERITSSFESNLPIRLLRNSKRKSTGKSVFHKLLKKYSASNEHKSNDYKIVNGSRQKIENHQIALENINIVDLFGEDFDGHSFRNASRVRPVSKIFRQRLSDSPVRLRIFEEGSHDPTFISGFLSIEIEELSQMTLCTGEFVSDDHSELVKKLRDSFKLLSPLSVQHDTRGIVVCAHFNLDHDLLSQSEVFLHWGNYPNTQDRSSPASPWLDDEISLSSISQCKDSSLYFEKEIKPERSGDYGVTMFVKPLSCSEKVWAGVSKVGDAQFSISDDQLSSTISDYEHHITKGLMLQGMLQQAVADYEIFIQDIYKITMKLPLSEVQKGLFEITRDAPELQNILSRYYAKAKREILTKAGLSKKKIERVLSVLENIGIGEVVFISPEGPHAIAGGLAQMITGITESIARRGTITTLITSLYDEAQGNQHKSANELIRDGICMQGEKVTLRYLGLIDVKFGPVYDSQTCNTFSNPINASVQVYVAEAENCRIFFLKHRRFANRLYPTEWADQQLMRAIFLSRGALEILRDPRFGISVSTVVTNDWLAALTQVFLRTDPTYATNAILSKCQTMHIIHNAGRDYQGCIPLNQFGKNLWPLLCIGTEHINGLIDDVDPCFINLTKGAAYHTQGAIVAVSKPYAEQLLKTETGECLDTVLEAKRDILFGISNGIDVETIRSIFFKIGETSRGIIDSTQSKVRPSGVKFIQKVLLYKKLTKSYIQRKYALVEDPNALLVSMIGRLVEQKGICLLSKEFKNGISLLEHVLISNPTLQIVIGGPVTAGDCLGKEIRVLLEDLSILYPGRIKGVVDFIQHKDALAITLASDLFLMPSRFEPGGITQLEALAAGSVVVAHKVGGLAATLKEYSEDKEKGDSFLFNEYTSASLLDALQRAIAIMQITEKREKLVLSATKSEHDWSFRLPKYMALFQHMIGALSSDNYRYLRDKMSLIGSIKVVT